MPGATRRRGSLLLVAGLLAALVVGGWAATAAGLHHRLYRALLYTAVANRVTRGLTSEEEITLRLNEFVYLNVRTRSGAALLDDSAADTLIRGFAFCDSADLALIRLLMEMGIPGNLTFLKDVDRSSPHSVAQVFLDGEWRVVDTLYGQVWRRSDGELATVEDLASRPDLLAGSRIDPVWFRNTFIQIPPEQLAPGLNGRLGGVVRVVVSALPDRVVDWLQDLYLLLPPPVYTARDYDTEAPIPFEDYSTSDSRLFFRARNLHLFLRADEAAAAYAELARRYPQSTYADDALYEMGVLDVSQRRDPEAALRTFEAQRTSYPDSDWKDEVLYFQARAHEMAGSCSAATSLYRQIAGSLANGRDDATARLQRLRCG